jgi:hypothetical protein
VPLLQFRTATPCAQKCRIRLSKRSKHYPCNMKTQSSGNFVGNNFGVSSPCNQKSDWLRFAET